MAPREAEVLNVPWQLTVGPAVGVDNELVQTIHCQPVSLPTDTFWETCKGQLSTAASSRTVQYLPVTSASPLAYSRWVRRVMSISASALLWV